MNGQKICFLQSVPIQKIKERETGKGHSDLELVTKITRMVIAFKCTSASHEPQASLKNGVNQIKSSQYGKLFSKTHKIYRVVMIISTSDKKIIKEYSQDVV